MIGEKAGFNSATCSAESRKAERPPESLYIKSKEAKPDTIPKVKPALKRAIEFIKKEGKPAVVDTVTPFR